MRVDLRIVGARRLALACLGSILLAGLLPQSASATPTSPYAASVMQDSPAIYFRLDEANGAILHDSSGAGHDGLGESGVTYGTDGALLGDPGDTAVTWPSGNGTAITQSGSALPSGNAPRTLEFWWRTGNCAALPSVAYGGSGSGNDLFKVGLAACSTINGTSPGLNLLTGGQKFTWSLPAAWSDANWHLFDVTYDGTTATGYMDGQVVGSSTVPTALATATPGAGLRVGDDQNNGCCTAPDDVDELAVYPTALSPARIDAHWQAQLATPPGMSLIAGTATQGNGTGIAGAHVQACPVSGAPCTANPSPTTSSGHFHVLVPDGSYAVTVFPPAGSPDGPKTTGPLALPPSRLDLSMSFSPPDGLPEGASLSTPAGGRQEDVVPRLNWGSPATLTESACKHGFGTADVEGVNSSTGVDEVVSRVLVESPPGSGSYSAEIPPLAPIHGSAHISQTIACPGQSQLIPNGGDEAGGTEVLIAGTGFEGAEGVSFGPSAARSYEVLSDNLIKAVSPAGTGQVAVSVRDAGGHDVSAGDYSYFGVSLETTSGPSSGGTPVTIRGAGFTDVKAVTFGILPAASYTVVSPTEIDAVSPPGLGTTHVQVVKGLAASGMHASDTFAYTGGPAGTSDIKEGNGPDAVQNLAVTYSWKACVLPDAPTELCVATAWLDRHLLPKPQEIGACPVGFPLINNSLISCSLGGAAIRAAIPICETTAICNAVIAAALTSPGILAAIAGVVVGYGVYELLHHFHPFGLFIDPSGTVTNARGDPIGGAQASLLAKNPQGQFTLVGASSGALIPAENPEVTDASGQFDWDALAGTYEVEASAPGCSAPGEPAQSDVFTAPFTLPPPAVGLMLRLECPGAEPLPPAPQVGGLSVAGGSPAGGNVVEVFGEGLADVTAVHFGGTQSSHVQVLSPYAVAALAPAGSGTVDVTVTGSGQTSAHSDADRYTYTQPATGEGAPVIESLTPASGPVSGGTAVTIRGQNLEDAYAVEFGGGAATALTPISDTEVQAVAPASVFATRVDTSVTTAAGTSAPTAADIFTYGSPPPLTATSLSLAGPPSPTFVGQPVTLSATVTPTDGGGIVAFYADGSPTPIAACGEQAPPTGADGYLASCTAALPAGSHAIEARYSGDASYASSSGSASVAVLGVPANAVRPVVSGVAFSRGKTVSASRGTWTNSPTAYTFEWQRCDGGGAGCTAIAGATGQTYTLSAADVRHTLRVQVSASNPAGSGSAASSAPTPSITVPRGFVSLRSSRVRIRANGVGRLVLACHGSARCVGSFAIEAMATGERRGAPHRPRREKLVARGRYSDRAGRIQTVRFKIVSATREILLRAGRRSPAILTLTPTDGKPLRRQVVLCLSSG